MRARTGYVNGQPADPSEMDRARMARRFTKLEPDLSRGSAPPQSPQHHDDYRRQFDRDLLDHPRLARVSRPMSAWLWLAWMVALAGVCVAVSL